MRWFEQLSQGEVSYTSTQCYFVLKPLGLLDRLKMSALNQKTSDNLWEFSCELLRNSNKIGMRIDGKTGQPGVKIK